VFVIYHWRIIKAGITGYMGMGVIISTIYDMEMRTTNVFTHHPAYDYGVDL